MNLTLHNRAVSQNILVLGAGASVDYGLPTWTKLHDLVSEKITHATDGRYEYRNELKEWIDKVGDKEKGKKYPTIDLCIAHESASKEFHTNGAAIENELFGVIKEVLSEQYSDKDGGWIRVLNEKILRNKEIVREMCFVNFNYDYVLEKNFLVFDHLPQKRKELNHRSELELLAYTSVPVLYPHGYLFEDEEVASTHLERSSHTMKSGVAGYIDAVSCYESERHVITTGPNTTKIKLFVFGLGNGLQVNLNNLEFDVRVAEAHVTVKNVAKRDEVVDYLSERYKISREQIAVYEDCSQLTEACF